MHPVMRQLHDDHDNVARLLDYINGQVEAARSGEQPDYDRLHRVMHYLTNYPDVFHHPREDLVFAQLLERDVSARLAIERLKSEHQELGDAGAHLRQRLHDKLAGKRYQQRTLLRELSEYSDLLREHMELEEHNVFPLAKLLLNDADWEAIAGRIRKREEPLFGDTAVRPYETLLTELERHER